MDCPACHAQNAIEASTCTTCGRSLHTHPSGGNGEQKPRRPNPRRRKVDSGEAAALDSPNPAARRAYRMSLWSIVPGFGLLLGPVAMVLGALAMHGAGDDLSARNRGRTAILFGFGSALTQWAGVVLIYFGWHS